VEGCRCKKYAADFLELQNYFSKDKSVEYVHGPWTGSTTLRSMSPPTTLNHSRSITDGQPGSNLMRGISPSNRVVGFLMDGGECLTGQGQWRSGKNTAAAMARRSSSPEQEWDDALMHETQRGRALNETKAMGILTRGFSPGGDG
jgi:hypothetical protein